MNGALAVGIQDVVRNCLIWQYTSASALALLCYEYIITFEDELEHVWRRPRSFFCVLWVLLRYPILLSFMISVPGLFTPELAVIVSSVEWLTVVTILTYISLLTAHLIYLLRTYALYSRARMVLVLCVPLFLAEVGIVIYSLVSMVVAIDHQTFPGQWHPHPSPSPNSTDSEWGPHPPGMHNMGGGPGGVLPFTMPMMPLPARSQRCMPGVASNCASTLAYSMPFLFDSVIAILTIRRSMQVASREKCTRLIRVLIRDGVVYYAISAVFYASTMIVMLAAGMGIQMDYASLPIVFVAILATRFVLNLRKLGPSPSNAGGSEPHSLVVLTNLNDVIDELANAEVGTWELPETEENARIRTSDEHDTGFWRRRMETRRSFLGAQGTA
ncbi:hypothetical protein EXIGLDRAFT_838899 [Exidia glandulosa HHB12029]|uniref:DUF6533 domain-containing protein n=1 Tax=Exidia glandulosa HHB12029 TaxID=1314781 RepID=A0A166A6C4_EXIGL|nr:hypothetical protein EXIGLDRAFT_838899 [Exidia glandulosa HHB12029]